MKRQISLPLCGAVVATLLVLFSAQSAFAAEGEVKEHVPQIENASIVDLGSGKTVVVVSDPTATKVSAKKTSLVSDKQDGTVDIEQTTVVTVPAGKAEEVIAELKEGKVNFEVEESSAFDKFLDRMGKKLDWIRDPMDDILNPATGSKPAPDEERFSFLYHDSYMTDYAKLQRQSLKDEQVKETSEPFAITDKKKLDDAAIPKVKPEDEEEKEKVQEPFYEQILFQEEINGTGSADEEISVSIVFNSAPILDVIPAFAEALGFNFVVDTDVRMAVTLNLNSRMTKRELWAAFATLIENAGVGVTVEDSLIRILPPNKFSARSKLDINSEDAEILFYPLHFASAQEIIGQIRPFLSNSATCIQVQRPNAILLCDYKANIKKLKQLVEILDDNQKTKWPRIVVQCENILPSKIAEELRTIFPVLGFVVKQLNDNSNSTNEQPGSIKIGAVDRLQILVASAATPEAIQEIRNWISILDGAVSLDQERIFVHKVMYTKSEQLMQALSVLYNMTGTSLTIDDDGGSRTTNINGSGSNRTTTTRTNSNSDSYYVATTTDKQSNVFETPVKIFSDGALNRLVVRTTPRAYASIKALLDRLDVVPAQVLLQVTIAEISKKDGFDFGMEGGAVNYWGGKLISLSNNTGAGSSTDLQDPQAYDFHSDSNKGLRFLIANEDNPDQKMGYLRASATDNNVKIVACPQLLVASNTEATLNVGEQTPYVGSSTTNTSSSTGAVSETITYKDTGIKMIVTPQVTSTDLITLKLNQEISSVEMINVTDKTKAPNVTTRTLETSMTIHNGQTMVIGGFIREDTSDNLTTLPFIGEIPIIRRLLGNTTASQTRREILILITGHIVNEKSRVEDMLRRYNDALDAITEFEDNLGDSADGHAKSPYQRMFY